MDSNIIGQTAF